MFLTYHPRPAGLSPWWKVDRVLVPVAGMNPPEVLGPSHWFGAVSSWNLLDPAFLPPDAPAAGSAECRRLICDSGHLAGSSRAEESFANWGPRVRPALDAACAGLAVALTGAGLTLCLRPRAGDAISDVPSSLSFLRAHGEGPFGLFFEPGALLDESMLARAEEHFDRALGAMLDRPGVCAVVATNVARDDDGRLTSAPLHRGLLDPRLAVQTAERAGAAGLPVVLHPADLTGQFRALGVSTPGF